MSLVERCGGGRGSFRLSHKEHNILDRQKERKSYETTKKQETKQTKRLQMMMMMDYINSHDRLVS